MPQFTAHVRRSSQCYGSWPCRLRNVTCGLIAATLVALSPPLLAQGTGEKTDNAAPSLAFDAELAKRTGANENGMRSYVFVLLKSGPNKMPAGPERDEMFKGHFANMKRLAAEGKLVMAGPFDGVDGWRGLFIFATPDIDEAMTLHQKTGHIKSRDFGMIDLEGKDTCHEEEPVYGRADCVRVEAGGAGYQG